MPEDAGAGAAVGRAFGSLAGPEGAAIGTTVGAIVAATSEECESCEEKEKHDSRKDGDPHRT